MIWPEREKALIQELKDRCNHLGIDNVADFRLERLSIDRIDGWFVVALMNAGHISTWPIIHMEVPLGPLEVKPRDYSTNYEMLECYALPVLRRSMVLDELSKI